MWQPHSRFQWRRQHFMMHHHLIHCVSTSVVNNKSHTHSEKQKNKRKKTRTKGKITPRRQNNMKSTLCTLNSNVQACILSITMSSQSTNTFHQSQNTTTTLNFKPKQISYLQVKISLHFICTSSHVATRLYRIRNSG